MGRQPDAAPTHASLTELAPSLPDIVQATVAAVTPARIILFGSRARGDSRPDSDLDLLVVLDDPFTPQHTRQSQLRRIRQALRAFRIPIDILLYSQKEIDAWCQSPNHVIARSLREGVTLYARS